MYRSPLALAAVAVAAVAGIVGNEIPNIAKAEGYFCPATVRSGRYRWSIKAGALVVHALDDRECADRNSLWNGRFTR